MSKINYKKKRWNLFENIYPALVLYRESIVAHKSMGTNGHLDKKVLLNHNRRTTRNVLSSVSQGGRVSMFCRRYP